MSDLDMYTVASGFLACQLTAGRSSSWHKSKIAISSRLSDTTIRILVRSFTLQSNELDNSYVKYLTCLHTEAASNWHFVSWIIVDDFDELERLDRCCSLLSDYNTASTDQTVLERLVSNAPELPQWCCQWVISWESWVGMTRWRFSHD